jgi:hypothetical protein
VFDKKGTSVEEVDGMGVVVEGDDVVEVGSGVVDVPGAVEVVVLMVIVVDEATAELVVSGVLTVALVVKNAVAVVDKAALVGGVPQ